MGGKWIVFFLFDKVLQSRLWIRKLVLGVNRTIHHSGNTSKLVGGQYLTVRISKSFWEQIGSQEWIARSGREGGKLKMVGEFLKLAGRLGLSFGAELYLFCDGLLYLLRVFVMDSINFMSPWTVNQLKRSY